MIKICTATYDNLPLARLWHRAIVSTFSSTEYRTIIYHAKDRPNCADEEHPWDKVEIPENSHPAGHAVHRAMPKSGVRLFIEEDMIPLRPWSIEDYPGNPGLLCGLGRIAWYAFTIYRDGPPKSKNAGYTPVLHRNARDYMPDWMPKELRDPVLEADAKIVGDHFLHIDRISSWHSSSPAKLSLIETLKVFYRV